jgi:alpha-L-fucosidase 2
MNLNRHIKPLIARIVALGILVLGLASSSPVHGAEPVIWFTQPAAKWTEALPLGNGRLGAMVFGGSDQEHLQLN